MMFKAIMVQAVKKSTLLINGYHNLNKFTSSKSQALELLMFQNWNFIDNSRMLHDGNLKFQNATPQPYFKDNEKKFCQKLEN